MAISNLQTNLWVHITSNIFQNIQFKNQGIAPTPPPRPPNFESLPYPGVGGKFGIFSLKWRERMNLKVPGAILPLGCAILSTRAKTVRGVGTTPLRRTRVNPSHLRTTREPIMQLEFYTILNSQRVAWIIHIWELKIDRL